MKRKLGGTDPEIRRGVDPPELRTHEGKAKKIRERMEKRKAGKPLTKDEAMEERMAVWMRPVAAQMGYGDFVEMYPHEADAMTNVLLESGAEYAQKKQRRNGGVFVWKLQPPEKPAG